MATIINSISFENFYNYFGSYANNTYNFTKGINIVNADNNMGKSKFYNGILWLLEGTVYDSDSKKMESVDKSYLKMASGKAKNELDAFNMGVKIVFTEGSTIYTVNKHIEFNKENDSFIRKNEIFDVIQTIENKDIPILDIDAKQAVLSKLIPTSLRNYALLQGESMERLVDLSSRDGLSSTIDALAGISIIREVCESSKKISSSIRTLFRTKDAELSSKNQTAKLERENYERTLKSIEKAYDQLEQFKIELDAAKSAKEDLEAMLASATKRGGIREKLANLEREIEQEKKQKNKLESSVTSYLFNEQNPWLLMGLESEIDKYCSLREKHIADIAKLDSNNTLVIMLPEGSPDVASLHRMLEHCKCEVCGQDAPKNSEAWNHIKTILDRPQKSITTQNDLSAFLGTLQRNASGYSKSIPIISDSIEQLSSEIDNKQDSIDEKQEQLNNFITELSNAGGSSKDSETKDMDILEKFQLVQNTIQTKTKEIEQAESALQRLEVSKTTYEKKRSKENTNTEVQKYRNLSELMDNIEFIFNETKERIFDEVLLSLEKEANDKYSALTSGNQTSGGKLSFKKQTDGTVKVSIRDVNNGVVTGLGTGFQRMKQLSIVMAIISSKIGGKQFDYPFISDAPFSEFGDKFVTNFFDIAPNVFSQSIILIKELYDPENEQYINTLGKSILRKMTSGEIPGSFYVNVIENKADTTNLVTSHKCYKI